MITKVQLNPITEAFVKEAHKIMRNKGYKLKSSKYSAEIEYRYDHPSGKHISICGWHGNGKYGHTKFIFDVYDGDEQTDIFVSPGNKAKDFGAGMPRSFISETNRTTSITREEFEAYKINIEKAKAFLMQLK